MYEKCVALLKSRGVEISDIIECVVFLQKDYVEDIDSIDIKPIVNSVLNKREVQHALITGINIDISVENNNFGGNYIEDIIHRDEGLYGIDEVLAYGICNLYGSIALTNYGYIDKVKPGIIGTLNDHNNGTCNTFLDDIVGAIAASAASKLAHSQHQEGIINK
ncbi:phosphatidylglycerophosphatase A [Erysipelothrix rhusiopathiae]|uniref:phosphatidylglycerophosphatase A family protein n=1 Tax=Erysipelothrix rhusiopathiae TaxID=1648 RepID=UPI000F42F960|nr:phosphatidylglycerophosphatase A [Erysipelothrix rhusiopathiae]AYV34430.1 phosphatidylglycerophosphatase A [Erysipelothrix rhusiopathiae]MDE8081654.1 phosphatidylglycerophosphatase A [Erysipelothrix rhusiopathiae]MDE8314925.1 phosphatidylglycerophosphatase A [Erysipelothrix rhusiopathiae]MDE8330289.1 phosphatidylglycerophosphatase A [Erysipelothrix rhusiopathiae]MDE8332462.1 phosphatidylglycerophosphatase A [Erysipelothrix rhusiopathiae]